MLRKKYRNVCSFDGVLYAKVRSARIVIQCFRFVKHDYILEFKAVIGEDSAVHNKPLAALRDQENLFGLAETE